MSITSRAQAEAEKRWPGWPLGNASDRHAFASGAEWAASLPPTDEEVEAAARKLAYWDGAEGWGTPQWDGEITETAYLHGARMALNAARGAQ